MIVYLASPNTQQQAEKLSGMPTLLSFAIWSPWIDRYQQTFSRILIDSGAFSELNSGVKVDLGAYKDWSSRWVGHADAIAGLDSIEGDWRQSMKSYGQIGWSFPTIHDTDPPELLPELVEMAISRDGWLGIGLKPPRNGKEAFVRWVCDNVPDELHLHGWALRAYTHIRRLDSVDSTNWWRDAMRFRRDFPWLTYGECLELVIKRYQRWTRTLPDHPVSEQLRLEGVSQCRSEHYA